MAVRDSHLWQALIDDLLTAAGDFETRYPHFTESLLGVRSVFTELLNPIVKVSRGGRSTYPLEALLEVLSWRSLANLEYVPCQVLGVRGRCACVFCGGRSWRVK